MTPSLRVGVIGAGYIAGAHLAAYRAVGGVTVVAVADRVPAKAERLAGRFETRAAASLDELLDIGVDAVSVCTPSPTHADLVVSALGAGLHVLCEKPIARSLTDAERIVAAGEAAPGVLMIGHVSRFEPDHARAKQLVEQGAIGTVKSMKQSIRSPMPTWSEGGWLEDGSASGGPIVDLGIHSFDYLSWIGGGPPLRVHCVASGGTESLATYALATVRFGDDAMALVESSWAHPSAGGLQLETEIVGTEGRISWDYESIRGGTMTVSGQPPAPIDVLGNRGFRDEIGAFVTAVRTGGPSPVPATEGRAALRTALGALESAQRGVTVELSAGGGS